MRLFTKSPDNYVRAWQHITQGFQKFYKKTLDIQLPVPETTAVKGLADWMAIEPMAKQSLYRILYMSNSKEEHMGFKRYLYDIHLSNTGMHLVRLFVALTGRLNCDPRIVLKVLDTMEFERRVNCLLKVLTLMQNDDGNHRRRMWKYGRIFDETFMADIQTKACPKLVYVFAEALKSVAPQTYAGVTNIVQLGDVSDANKERCRAVAGMMLRTIKDYMKRETQLG